MTDLIKGFATPEATEAFAQAALEKALVAENHYRLDKNGLTLSSIGLGTYLGDPDAETNEQVTQAVIQSIESGAINIIDTAINYRYQLAERSIGKALKTLFEEGQASREDLFIASKIGYLTPDGDVDKDYITYVREEYIETGIFHPDEVVSGIHCMSANFLANQLQRSRNNLGVNTLDLLYLHNAAESQLPSLGKEGFLAALEEAFAFFEDAREDGHLKHYGMATWNSFTSVEGKVPFYLSLEEVVNVARKVGGDDHGFAYIQLPYNMGMTEALNRDNQMVNGKKMSILHAAQALNVGVFTSVPLMQGQLLQFDLPTLPEVESKAQICVQFVRSTPGIIAPLVGQKQSQHVAENISLAQIPPLPFEQFHQLFASQTA